MAFFDFMSGGGKSSISPDADILSGQRSVFDQGGSEFGGNGGGFNASELFADPNFIRMLGETGAAISGPGTIGNAVGKGASSLVRRRQFQNAAGKKNTLMEQITEALKEDPTGSSLLGDKEDKKTLNSIKLTNKGIALEGPNSGETSAFGDIRGQKDLESVTNNQRSERGTDLSDFF